MGSNWRLAAENGFDAAHIYIHRNSPLILEQKRPLPLATIDKANLEYDIRSDLSRDKAQRKTQPKETRK